MSRGEDAAGDRDALELMYGDTVLPKGECASIGEAVLDESAGENVRRGEAADIEAA